MNKFPILLFAVVLVTGSCTQTAINSKRVTAPQNANKPATSRNGEKTSLDYLREGEDLFNAYDFDGAIGPYKQALDLEKKERKLERERWITLVNDLAKVYGLTDDLNRSREVLDYGIEQEPTYPMFYYLKACSYGLKNDETNALKNLRLAYQHKENKLKNESLPDPATDNSFKTLMERKNFEKAVEEIKKN
jgi:hypothetical protein